MRLLKFHAVAAALLLAAAAHAQPANAPVLPLSELQPGMKGEVWTVFRGSESEPFAVQVTGILQNALGPGKSLILCELTDPRVQPMGAVAGMSGSPLYIDGKLVGVLSYQIQKFETVRYAGFTPIADMLEVSALPAGTPAPATTLPIPVKTGPRARDDRPAQRSTSGDFQPFRPVFSLGGIAPQVAEVMAPQFEAIGLNAIALGGNLGSAAAELPAAPAPNLKPGGVVAAALAVGDITMAASGTVSHIDGAHVLAFGHPLMTLGATEVPMAEAEIVTILPSSLNSIKVANTGRVIGTFSQDRLSAIYGEVGRMPHLVPVEIDLPSRLNRKSLKFAVVQHEMLLPAIAATGLTQAVLGSNEAGLTRGFRLRAIVDYAGRDPVEFSRLYPGPQGFAQGVGEFTANLQQWLFNPYERTFPEKIRFAVEETSETPVGYLELLQVSRTTASAGEKLTATISWRGFQSEKSTETVEIPVSAEWTGKDLEVVLANGRQLDDLTGRPRSLNVSQLRTFDEYLGMLRDARDSDGLYLAVVERTALFSDSSASTVELP
ncbi:MAG TPA: SpoIVB peptidase S55 domain-containing protein, partial [Acidobacteriota bacterium]|nr:SpoIVB peptidase S55 domain-containing protein [Acidobacteriota bacterium]